MIIVRGLESEGDRHSHWPVVTPNSDLNPNLQTLNPKPSTLNPQPSTINPQLSTLNPQPSTLNPQPSTLNPQPSTLNPRPSTSCPKPGYRRRGAPRLLPHLSPPHGGPTRKLLTQCALKVFLQKSTLPQIPQLILHYY